MKGPYLRADTAANQDTIRAWLAMGHQLQVWATRYGMKKDWVDFKPAPYIHPWYQYRIKPQGKKHGL